MKRWHASVLNAIIKAVEEQKSVEKAAADLLLAWRAGENGRIEQFLSARDTNVEPRMRRCIALIRWVCKRAIPLSALEDEEFCAFTKARLLMFLHAE